MKKSKRILTFAISTVLSLSMLSQVAFAHTNAINPEARRLAQELLAADTAEAEARRALGAGVFSVNDVAELGLNLDIENAQEFFRKQDTISVEEHNIENVDMHEFVADELKNELDKQDIDRETERDKSIQIQNTFNGVQLQENAVAQYPFERNSNSRAVGINDPNNAFYLDSSLLNIGLSNVGDYNPDWYYFSADAGTKITAVFEQPNNGDYDIYLFQLDGSTLSLVAYSENYGSMGEQINYIADTTGYYFFFVVPYQPAQPSAYYGFTIRTSIPDSMELNDSYATATVHSDSINVSLTIDNPFDEDWFLFTTIGQDHSYNRVSLENVPDGSSYAVILYDQNLNSVSSFQSTGSEIEMRNWPLDANTTYYIRVLGVNDSYSDTQEYQLRVTPVFNGGYLLTTPGGNLFQIYNQQAYVDGELVDMSWGTESRIPIKGMPWVSRVQSIGDINGGIKVLDIQPVGGSYQGYSATGDYPFVISSDNVVRVLATNLFYFYYYYHSPSADYTIPSENRTFTDRIEDNYAAFFYIDANTKTLMDTGQNLYYWSLGYGQVFTEIE